MAHSLRFLDLFAGAGGLSEGFARAGFDPVAHVEVDRAACLTLRTRTAFHWLGSHGSPERYEDYLHGRITRSELYRLVPRRQIDSVINAEIGEASLPSIFNSIDEILDGAKLDLIIGGPPCQAYSIVGRSRDSNRMKGDKRNRLYRFYAEFLRYYKPSYFVFENVVGLFSARDEMGTLFFSDMQNLFHDAAYETEYRVLSADDYGVLQNRKRIVLVGRRGKETGFYPQPEKWHPGVNVGELLMDLPPLEAGQGTVRPCPLRKYEGTYLYDARIRGNGSCVTWHQARPNTEQDLEIYRLAVEQWNTYGTRLSYETLPGRLQTHDNVVSFLDRFKVVASDLLSSQTVVAHIAKDGHYYIHPDINQNRSLTPREAARLQTFPDDYFFESMSTTPGRTAAFRQIGNAVPVLLATKIAEQLREAW